MTLAMRGVSLVRGGRLLFAGFDLELGRGEAAVLRGANGAGKSSLLRLAAGLLRPDAGTVGAARAALQDEGLALERRLPLRRALGFWTGDARLGAAMAAMGLTALAAVPVAWLSAGQRRRAQLARVVASGAPLWLLDEPANALDADGAERLAAAVAAHRAAGGTVLAAAHGGWTLDGAREVALGPDPRQPPP